MHLNLWTCNVGRASCPSNNILGISLFAAALIIFNTTLLSKNLTGALIYLPDAVSAGEWWRLLTYPFVHVSFYHLLIDGLAFVVLYRSLLETRFARRVLYIAGAGMGSMLAATFAATETTSTGLCGLSGIAHGLMTVSALEFMRTGTEHNDRISKMAGLVSLILIIGKSLIEAITGSVIFGWMHIGYIGYPIAICHAGGVVGALIAYSILNHRSISLPFPIAQHLA
jgi:rhomboid family GlyGly-CTERM serine protease